MVQSCDVHTTAKLGSTSRQADSPGPMARPAGPGLGAHRNARGRTVQTTAVSALIARTSTRFSAPAGLLVELHEHPDHPAGGVTRSAGPAPTCHHAGHEADS